LSLGPFVHEVTVPHNDHAQCQKRYIHECAVGPAVAVHEPLLISYAQMLSAQVTCCKKRNGVLPRTCVISLSPSRNNEFDVHCVGIQSSVTEGAMKKCTKI
jgi:hypothetical protein